MSFLRGSMNYVWCTTSVLGKGATGAVFQVNKKNNLIIINLLRYVFCSAAKLLRNRSKPMASLASLGGKSQQIIAIAFFDNKSKQVSKSKRDD